MTPSAEGTQVKKPINTNNAEIDFIKHKNIVDHYQPSYLYGKVKIDRLGSSSVVAVGGIKTCSWKIPNKWIQHIQKKSTQNMDDFYTCIFKKWTYITKDVKEKIILTCIQLTKTYKKKRLRV